MPRARRRASARPTGAPSARGVTGRYKKPADDRGLMTFHELRRTHGDGSAGRDRRDVPADPPTAAMADGELPPHADREPRVRGLSLLPGPSERYGGLRIRLLAPRRRPPRRRGCPGGRRVRLRPAAEWHPPQVDRRSAEQRGAAARGLGPEDGVPVRIPSGRRGRRDPTPVGADGPAGDLRARRLGFLDAQLPAAPVVRIPRTPS